MINTIFAWLNKESKRELAELCCKDNKIEELYSLVDLGAPIEKECLLQASKHGNDAIVSYLFHKFKYLRKYRSISFLLAGRKNHVNVLRQHLLFAMSLNDLKRTIEVACSNGHVAVVSYILNQTNFEFEYDDGKIALGNAIECGSFEIVELLVEHGARTTSASPIHNAVKYGRLDILKLLVSCGADIRISNDWPICTALGYGHQDIVDYLLQQGASVKDCKIDDALRMAVNNGDVPSVKKILAYGANVNAEDSYALGTSIARNDVELTEALLEHKADVHFNNDFPLYIAAYHGHHEIASLLVKYGADLDKAMVHLEGDSHNENAIQVLKNLNKILHF